MLGDGEEIAAVIGGLWVPGIEAAGGSVANIVKTTVFLTNFKDFGKMNRVYKQFFEDNGVYEKFPARSTVEVSNLVVEGLIIEIDAIAAL